MKKFIFIALISILQAKSNYDFSGKIGFEMESIKNPGASNKFFNGDGSILFGVTAKIKKELVYGFGIGAEIGALIEGNDKFNKTKELTELSQLYLAYKYKNTTLKMGRFELSEDISPLTWSERTASVIDVSYNGIVIVNQDLPDTTIATAWIKSYTEDAGSTKIGENGLFMFGATKKLTKDSTINITGYYTKNFIDNNNYLSVWSSLITNISGIDFGAQVAYAKIQNKKATLAAATFISKNFNNIEATLTLAYINNGKASINPIGSNAFWGDSLDGIFGSDIDASKGKQKIVRLDLGYEFTNQTRIYGGVAANKVDLGSTEIAAQAGYEFKVANIDMVAQYSFLKDNNKQKSHSIKIEGVYRF